MKANFDKGEPMKVLLIALMMILSLMLYGCGERNAEEKAKTLSLQLT